MASATPPGMTQIVSTWVHRIVIASLTFWMGAISLGLVLGLVPAQSVLLAEVRTWGRTPNPPPGIFQRMIRGTWQNFKPALWGSVALSTATGCAVATWYFAGSTIGAITLLTCAFWSALFAGHFAWRTSLRLPVGPGIFVEFAVCAWLQLVAAVLWIVPILLLPILYLLPIAFFLPTLVAFVIVTLEPSARAFAGRVH